MMPATPEIQSPKHQIYSIRAFYAWRAWGNMLSIVSAN